MDRTRVHPKPRFRLAGSHVEEAVLLALAGFLFLVATNTQTGWLYVASALLVGVLVAGFLGPRATLRRLEIHQRVPAPVSQGDMLHLGLEVFNPGPSDRTLVLVEQALPDSLPGQPRHSRFLIERLPAGATVRIECPIPASLRGYHRLPSPRLSSATPLGLFPFQRSLPAGKAPLIVYPRPLELAGLAPSSRRARPANQERTSNRVGSSEDFLGIRPYFAGEDTRFIHWPATARTGQVMIREFRGRAGQGMAVLVETGQEALAEDGPDSALETAISAAATLVEKARRQGIPLTLVSEWDGQVRLSKASGEGALDFLARIQAPGRLSRAEFLEEAARRTPADAHLFLLLPSPLADTRDLAPLLERRSLLTLVMFPDPANPAALEACRQSIQALDAAGVQARIHQPDSAPHPNFREGATR